MTKSKKDIDQLLADESDAIDADRDAPIRPGTRVTRGHSRTRTLQVRLNDEEYEALSRAAQDQHLPESTYARSVLLDALIASPKRVTGGQAAARSSHRQVVVDVDDLLRAVNELAHPVD